MSPELNDLFKKIFVINPHNRIRYYDLYQHDYFAKYKSNDIV